jgi:hypothetical protein
MKKTPTPKPTAPDPRDVQTDEERMMERGRSTEDGGHIIVREDGVRVFVEDA